jgi:hypothetical protein
MKLIRSQFVGSDTKLDFDNEGRSFEVNRIDPTEEVIFDESESGNGGSLFYGL